METNHIVKRRSFLKSASVLVSAAIVQGVPLGATALAAPAMSDAEKWTHAMAALGPRITCGQAHRKWITYLANAVSGMGLQVRRYPVPVRYWEATAWSLEVTDRAGYRIAMSPPTLQALG